MSGTLAGTDSWFGQGASQVSAHTGIGLKGERHGYVAYTNRAWANGILQPGNLWADTGVTGNPNDWTLSIETEDMGLASTPVSELQYRAVLQECHDMVARYPGIKWLLTHRAISPIDRPNCPGARWVGGRLATLAGTLGLGTIV